MSRPRPFGASGARRTYALGRALDSVVNYPLRSALIGFALGTVDALQLATFLKLQQANYPAPLYRCLMNLLSSHDVERVRSVLSLGNGCKHLPRPEQHAAVAGISAEQDERAAQLQRMLVGILYALPGTPCIYYGDERGLHGGGDPFCRATFPWDQPASRADCGRDLTAFYREIGQLRKASNRLKRGDLRCCAFGGDVLCIARTTREDSAPLIAIANRADSAIGGAFDLHALGWRCAADRHGLDALLGCGTASIESGIVHFGVGPRCTAYFG